MRLGKVKATSSVEMSGALALALITVLVVLAAVILLLTSKAA